MKYDQQNITELYLKIALLKYCWCNLLFLILFIFFLLETDLTLYFTFYSIFVRIILLIGHTTVCCCKVF